MRTILLLAIFTTYLLADIAQFYAAALSCRPIPSVSLLILRVIYKVCPSREAKARETNKVIKYAYKLIHLKNT
jgi:hypothetical protein